jgi:hypothetical protein
MQRLREHEEFSQSKAPRLDNTQQKITDVLNSHIGESRVILYRDKLEHDMMTTIEDWSILTPLFDKALMIKRYSAEVVKILNNVASTFPNNIKLTK